MVEGIFKQAGDYYEYDKAFRLTALLNENSASYRFCRNSFGVWKSSY